MSKKLLSDNTNQARNQIVGAWLWLRVRPKMTLYVFKKYRCHTVGYREALDIAALVGDIDRAKAVTCARDAWRAAKHNVLVNPETFLPGSRAQCAPLTGVTALIDAARKGYVWGHEEHVLHWAPAAVRVIKSRWTQS